MDVDSVLHDLGFTNIGGNPYQADGNQIEVDYEYQLKHNEQPKVILKLKKYDDGRR